MKLDDFDYHLPHELIAQLPLRERTASRLLHLDGPTGALRDLKFTDIVELIAPHDVLILNDTRVIKARLMGRKKSGGKLELLVERVLGPNEALVQMRASHAPREGSTLVVAEVFEATVLERRGQFFKVRFEASEDVFSLLDHHGAVPLPPYIEHAAVPDDEVRYQTVYASAPGAVAAPTAGLHFDQALLEQVRLRGTIIAHVTLHVGAGTFQPVRESDLAAHEMHGEWYTVPQSTVDAISTARKRGGSVVAVGTTTLRALESSGAAQIEAGTGETKLFILPGYEFHTVDRLITNFHLPKSTLLMLVSAFGGMSNIRSAYAHAIANRYRFFSYGDAMLIERAGAE
ncbi:MAG: S-adenosylmethionine:tRNA ribosyltransferase-isomerase [Betaproteobacteria bacterium]|nr:S-adenosylmethionine:tRNA ribosyltransferase-isomerase [Betaproteobacteria bacterium]